MIFIIWSPGICGERHHPFNDDQFLIQQVNNNNDNNRLKFANTCEVTNGKRRKTALHWLSIVHGIMLRYVQIFSPPTRKIRRRRRGLDEREPTGVPRWARGRGAEGLQPPTGYVSDQTGSHPCPYTFGAIVGIAQLSRPAAVAARLLSPPRALAAPLSPRVADYVARTHASHRDRVARTWPPQSLAIACSLSLPATLVILPVCPSRAQHNIVYYYKKKTYIYIYTYI